MFKIYHNALLMILSVLGIVQSVMAFDLALKYDFEPNQPKFYQTSVVAPAKTVKEIQTAIVLAETSNLRAVEPNVQVVAARNDVNKQPLEPTISYSYSEPSSSIAPVSQIVPARNYYKRAVELTDSDLNKDSLSTFVVGTAFNDKGYSQESKGALQRVDNAIESSPLVGCAPLSINCSRTASTDSQLSVRRGPIEQKPKQQRQLLNN